MEGYLAVTDKEELNVLEEALLHYSPKNDDFYSSDEKTRIEEIKNHLIGRIKRSLGNE